VRVRCADGGGTAGPTILLTSPWPESLYAFTPIWETLCAHARPFAVDLPGFGGSEGREDLLAPRAMGGFLARLVDETGLGRPFIVAPDVGTRPPCSRPPTTLDCSPVWSWAPAAQRSHSSWANPWPHGCSTAIWRSIGPSTRTRS